MNPDESVVSKNIAQICDRSINVKEIAGLFLFTSLFYLALGTLALRILWIIKMGSFAHWSYLVGNYFYPEDLHGNVVLGAVIFTVLTLGSFVPNDLFPRTKFLITTLNLAPQIHMLAILQYGIGQSIENNSLRRLISFYTTVTFICTVWSIFNLLRLLAQLN